LVVQVTVADVLLGSTVTLVITGAGRGVEVAVGGTGVGDGGKVVAVGGTAVEVDVGGTAVVVGSTGVFVAVGGTAVGVLVVVGVGDLVAVGVTVGVLVPVGAGVGEPPLKFAFKIGSKMPSGSAGFARDAVVEVAAAIRPDRTPAGEAPPWVCK
jgi:hypothetical protein